jgi:nickel/cobalt exporter
MALSSRARAVLGATAVVLGFLVLIGALDVALAQTSPFGGPRPPAAAPPEQAGGLVGWLFAKQGEFYRSFSGAIRAAKTDNAALWPLFGLTFAYGIFHAAGPGHGKAVISSYIVANDETWKRGVLLSFLSALLQAVVAIVIVGIAAALLNATKRTMDQAVWYIEFASYVVIALIGARLIWVKGQGFLAAWRKSRGSDAGRDQAHAHHHDDHAHHDHGHAHDHAHAHAAAHAHAHHDDHAHAHAEAHARHDHAHHDHAHDHDHAHHHDAHDHHGHDHDHSEHASAWGHAHGPEPKDLAGPGGWRRGLSAIVAVGLRPCSGAIIVLVFALAQGLFWAGAVATLIMGLGTAITVAAIASFAVGAKELANRFAQSRPGAGMLALRGLEVAASVVVFLFGVLLAFGYIEWSEQMRI